MELIEKNMYVLYVILAVIYFSKTSYAEKMPKELKEMIQTYTNEVIIAVYLVIAYHYFSKLK